MAAWPPLAGVRAAARLPGRSARASGHWRARWASRAGRRTRRRVRPGRVDTRGPAQGANGPQGAETLQGIYPKGAGRHPSSVTSRACWPTLAENAAKRGRGRGRQDRRHYSFAIKVLKSAVGIAGLTSRSTRWPLFEFSVGTTRPKFRHWPTPSGKLTQAKSRSKV